jgi:hypothetical protein
MKRTPALEARKSLRCINNLAVALPTTPSPTRKIGHSFKLFPGSKLEVYHSLVPLLAQYTALEQQGIPEALSQKTMT